MSYGAAAFVKSVSADILTDLLNVYDARTAYFIMAIAAIRILKPAIPISNIAAKYKQTFVSIYYPGCLLSTNTVSSLLKKLGQDGEKRREFYKLRMDAACKEHHIAIDGMLKQDTSIVNDQGKTISLCF